MFPWLMIWAPQLHFPFSGSVAQQIDPNWFFGAISPAAGDARIERQAFEVASYGRQLGLITEVLIALAEETAGKDTSGKSTSGKALPAPTAKSLARLKDIRARIEKIKAREGEAPLADIETEIARLQQADPAAYARLRTRLLALPAA